MARKTKLIQIKAEGRDQAKNFWLTEMDAEQAEMWAVRALLLATNAGVEIPPVQGMQAIALMSLKTLMHGVAFEGVKPLLDEMFECVQYIPDMIKAPPPAGVRKLFPGDIEEVSTRFMLRDEVLSLHLGFSLADALSKLVSMTSADQSTNNTQTIQPSAE